MNDFREEFDDDGIYVYEHWTCGEWHPDWNMRYINREDAETIAKECDSKSRIAYYSRAFILNYVGK